MTATAPKYRADIDGLRAIAVSAVLLYHAFPTLLPGGFVGVDVFFVISGYLISGIILSAARRDAFSFAHFYARRVRRIFPALTLVLVTVLAAGWLLLYVDDFARLGLHVTAGAAFLSNFQLWNESSYFDLAADLKPLLHLWSLGIEEQFYLVWPIVLALAARWRRGPMAVTVVIGASSFAVAIMTVQTDPTAAFYAPWTRFWELLAGALIACSDQESGSRGWLDRLQSSARTREGAAAAGLALIAIGVSVIDRRRMFPGFWVLLPVIGTALLIAVGAQAWVNRAILSRVVMVWLGMISYPLYLWHWPLLSFAKIVSGGVLPAWMRASLLGLSVGLAWMTYRIIERPVRFSLRSIVILPPLAAAMVLLYAAGFTVSAHEGFVDRPINRSDAAHLLDYYGRMHYHSLGSAYRFECDFNDRDTNSVRAALPASCLEHGRTHTILLWGDSFAQALSLGLRENLPPDTSLAQVATSACRAQIEDFDTSVEDNRCETSDRYAMKVIGELRPDIVILAQNAEHLDTDWAKLTGKILELGAQQVIVVGPSPMWDPTLPRVYATNHMVDHAAYVPEGLYRGNFDVDRELAGRVAALPHVSYVSLIGALCRGDACLAVVPEQGPLDLMVVDYGHLSPKGSSYIGRVIWRPLLAARFE